MRTRIHSLTALALATALLSTAASTSIAQTKGADDGTKAKSDQPLSDTWITTKVKSELATTDGVKSMDISVTTVDGVVTLKGTQVTDAAVRKAVIAAEMADGVKKVDATGLTEKQ